jgi:hypothetical protein
MTTRRPDPSENYERKVAALDEETRRAIRSAEAEIREEPNMSRLRRRTTRGTILGFEAADAGYAIEFIDRGNGVEFWDLYDLRYPVPP